ncbi:MAG TPA: Zn-ribbon domain-containing OB-fold protein [Acidimicrobiia bacterium]|nr:Zn-ribbon domain-containing OB-fold protein [Acidimicrobiia bacterium]
MSDAGVTEAGTPGPVTSMSAPVRLDYDISAGTAASRFLRGVAQKKLLGQRCPVCQKVYVPPRGSCPIHGVATDEEVEVGPAGTVTTFCVVNIAFSDLAPEIPYVCAQVLLDRANIAFFGLIAEVPAKEVRMGMRVETVWADEVTADQRSIKWFKPNGEPDAAYDSYKEYI